MKAAKVITFLFILTAISRILIDPNGPKLITAISNLFSVNAEKIVSG